LISSECQGKARMRRCWVAPIIQQYTMDAPERCKYLN
jgi:hypothetical protein